MAGRALESGKPFREHPSPALRGAWSSPLTHVPLGILSSSPWSSRRVYHCCLALQRDRVNPDRNDLSGGMGQEAVSDWYGRVV